MVSSVWSFRGYISVHTASLCAIAQIVENNAEAIQFLSNQLPLGSDIVSVTVKLKNYHMSALSTAVQIAIRYLHSKRSAHRLLIFLQSVPSFSLFLSRTIYRIFVLLERH